MPFRTALCLAAALALFASAAASADDKTCIGEPRSTPAATTTLYKLAWTPLNDEDRGRGSLICVTEDVFAAEMEKLRKDKPDIRVFSKRSCPNIKCPKGHIPVSGKGDEVICVHCEAGEYSFRDKCCK